MLEALCDIQNKKHFSAAEFVELILNKGCDMAWNGLNLLRDTYITWDENIETPQANTILYLKHPNSIIQRCRQGGRKVIKQRGELL